MTAPTLSVVVPTLDERAWLPHLLASLPDAGLQADDEVIVADGGSTDGTLAIARAGGARALSARRGRGAQLRSGARSATRDVLLFLHADMRLGSGSLDRLRDAFADPEVVATGMRQRIDGPGTLFRCIETVANWRVRLGRVYGDSGLALRRSFYERLGGFRELPLFEDLDLSRRVRRDARIRFLRGAELTVSARRWEERGILRQTLVNGCLTAAWVLGVEPERLVRYYPPHGQAAEAGSMEPR